ncbi:hypothetical protein BDN72DRAFT_953462 [Pluteus cervinus]|uniref:Uncharacterized protein n=1 Tax=Pluteus cervinus TaxID=181527 RepID=A0ACD3BGF4_9AGAR|nr:hypothetical protein BDN72DRAFT_953462 [Pluteus cervinus]
MFSPVFFSLLAFATLARAAVVWDADFDTWSWSNQVGTYQTYIYGNLHGEKASSWLTLGSGFKNPATTGAKQGIKVKVTGTSTWNGGPMLRTELIPQSSRSLSGNLYFHVSLQIPTVNPPNPAYEHQASSRSLSYFGKVCLQCLVSIFVFQYFPGHFADIKYGQLSGQNGVADTLQVITGGRSIWSTQPVKGTWYNFILGTGSFGGLWVSNGTSALTKVYTGSLNGNGGNDWHVGALRLPINGNTQVITEENIYYSGIYVEDSGPTTQP